MLSIPIFFLNSTDNISSVINIFQSLKVSLMIEKSRSKCFNLKNLNFNSLFFPKNMDKSSYEPLKTPFLTLKHILIR